jgi:lipopolysaccharide transport system ATP-binding protein
MASVKALCSRGVILENGIIKQAGEIDHIISNYLKGDSHLSNYKKGLNGNPLISLPELELFEIGVKAKDKKPDSIVTMDDKITFFATYKQKTTDKNIHITIHVKDELGNVVFTSGSGNIDKPNNEQGRFQVSVDFPDNFFNWGNFYIDLFIVENKRKAFFIEKDIISFTIVNKQKEIGTYMGKEPGAIHPGFVWNKETI